MPDTTRPTGRTRAERLAAARAAAEREMQAAHARAEALMSEADGDGEDAKGSGYPALFVRAGAPDYVAAEVNEFTRTCATDGTRLLPGSPREVVYGDGLLLVTIWYAGRLDEAGA